MKIIKVISTHSQLMSQICVDAVLKVADPDQNTLDLKDIQVICKAGGTLDETEFVDGLCLDQAAMGNTRRCEKAKIALIQFCLSPPKTDMENQVNLKATLKIKINDKKLKISYKNILQNSI
jgi:T-complex protein 1 subunit delta